MQVIYKEDKYSQMIENSNFNPFNVTTNEWLNSDLIWNDLTSVFKRELEMVIPKAGMYGLTPRKAFVSYAFNGIESYYKNAGHVPKAIVDVILEEMYEALQQTRYADIIDSLEDLKNEIYFALTHR